MFQMPVSLYRMQRHQTDITEKEKHKLSSYGALRLTNYKECITNQFEI